MKNFIGICMVFTCISCAGCWSTRVTVSTSITQMTQDAEIAINDFKCECNNLQNVNCSWNIADNVIVTVNNAPVLKFCNSTRDVHNNCNDEKWSDVVCNKSNTPTPLSRQYCYFQWDTITDYPTQDRSLQVFSMGKGRIPFNRKNGKIFTPKDKAVPLPPMSLRFLSPTPESLIVTWKRPAGWDSREPLLQYNVEYAEDHNASFIQLDLVNSETVNITGLHSYQSYCVRVHTINTGPIFRISGSWSEPRCSTTAEYVPASPKLHLPRIGKETKDENTNCTVPVTISWDGLVQSDWNGSPPLGYSVSICPISKGGERCKVQNTTNKLTEILTDLLVDNTYDIFVQAFNGKFISSKEQNQNVHVTNYNCTNYPVTPQGDFVQKHLFSIVVGSLIFILLLVFLVGCILKKYLLKTVVTSHIKGPIVIPNTNIVGPVKFKEMESETYTSIVEVDWNPSYGRYQSSDNETFNSIHEEDEFEKHLILQTEVECLNQDNVDPLLSPTSTCSSSYAELRTPQIDFPHSDLDSDTFQAFDSLLDNTLQGSSVLFNISTSSLNLIFTPSDEPQKENRDSEARAQSLYSENSFTMSPSDPNQYRPDTTHQTPSVGSDVSELQVAQSATFPSGEASSHSFPEPSLSGSYVSYSAELPLMGSQGQIKKTSEYTDSDDENLSPTSYNGSPSTGKMSFDEDENQNSVSEIPTIMVYNLNASNYVPLDHIKDTA